MSEQKDKKEHRFCPFCDEEILEASFPFCKACQVTMLHCPVCHKSLPRDNEVCPHCGAEIKAKTA